MVGGLPKAPTVVVSLSRFGKRPVLALVFGLGKRNVDEVPESARLAGCAPGPIQPGLEKIGGAAFPLGLEAVAGPGLAAEGTVVVFRCLTDGLRSVIWDGKTRYPPAGQPDRDKSPRPPHSLGSGLSPAHAAAHNGG